MRKTKEKYQFLNFLLGIFNRMLITADSNYKNCHVYYYDIDISSTIDMAIVHVDREKLGMARFIKLGKHRCPKHWKVLKMLRWSL